MCRPVPEEAEYEQSPKRRKLYQLVSPSSPDQAFRTVCSKESINEQMLHTCSPQAPPSNDSIPNCRRACNKQKPLFVTVSEMDFVTDFLLSGLCCLECADKKLQWTCGWPAWALVLRGFTWALVGTFHQFNHFCNLGLVRQYHCVTRGNERESVLGSFGTDAFISPTSLLTFPRAARGMPRESYQPVCPETNQPSIYPSLFNLCSICVHHASTTAILDFTRNDFIGKDLLISNTRLQLESEDVQRLPVLFFFFFFERSCFWQNALVRVPEIFTWLLLKKARSSIGRPWFMLNETFALPPPWMPPPSSHQLSKDQSQKPPPPGMCHHTLMCHPPLTPRSSAKVSWWHLRNKVFWSAQDFTGFKRRKRGGTV